MSRTDVHRPYLVQVTDPHNQHRVTRHQMWATEEPKLWPLYNTCGCNLCTGQASRRYSHHQERVAWRSVRRNLLKTQAADRGDMDWHTSVSVVW